MGGSASIVTGVLAHEIRSLSLQCRRASQPLGDKKLHQIFPIAIAPADSSIPPEPASASLVRNLLACLRHVWLHVEKGTDTVKMSKATAARDQVVKIIVGAGQASPSPPVGPALGSKGIKSMDFCKVRSILCLLRMLLLLSGARE